MGDRGLTTSIWASRNNANHSYSRPGDWNCLSCGFSNYQFRTECMKCSTSRTGTPRSSTPTSNATQQNSIPIQFDRLDNFRGQNEVTSNLAAPATTAPTQHVVHVQRGGGLAHSLWAPRNYNGRAKKADSSQVWIKKPSTNYVAASRQPYANSPTPSNPTSLDLGLPYEVQHFILAMIQRILEEGCYDFAFRWIPEILNERNYSCPEAVELSTWRDFLPDAILPDALVPVAGYSIQQGLKDAVRIRNAAVHRHLCDNFEIRRMAQQAHDLMAIFRDITRQNKFNQLREDLSDWDRNSNEDQQAAKIKLEQALLDINERPMDDMDWTPNALSLQEITVVDVEPILDRVDYRGDEMELD